jgi:hypothetical protein
MKQILRTLHLIHQVRAPHCEGFSFHIEPRSNLASLFIVYFLPLLKTKGGLALPVFRSACTCTSSYLDIQGLHHGISRQKSTQQI